MHIGDGEQGYFNISGFIGSGDSDVGRIGDDPFAYVASVEPFHGNALAVYCKDSDAPPDQAVWTRHVLDVFGDPNEHGNGELDFATIGYSVERYYQTTKPKLMLFESET